MRRVTLAQLFGAATFAVAIVVGVAFAWFTESSRASILKSSQRQQDLVARRVETRVVRELGRAQRVLEDVERGIHAGSMKVDPAQGGALEASLFTRILDDSHLEEVTFTSATLDGYSPNGDARIAPDSRWQLSVYRGSSGAILTKSTRRESGADGPFVAEIRDRGPDTTFASASFVPAGGAPDPTVHPTFSVIVSQAQHGKAVWSDLHWSELDGALSPRDRRVVVSVQKAIDDAAGRFVGVVRVGLVTNELDAIARPQASPGDPEDVQRVALLATAPHGGAPRIVARLDPADRMTTLDDEIRVDASRPPPEIRALLGSSFVHGLDRRHPNAAGSLVVDGAPWLATLREIDLGEGGTAGWMVAVLAPEERYTTDLRAFERMFVAAFAVTLAMVLAIAATTLIAMRRGLSRITAATTRMRAFDFAPVSDQSAIRDVDDVMHGLERAKTVVRAMGKYVPIDLVQRLYSSNEEPKLGGEMIDVSLMFTDIEGFTTLAEKLPPDELAKRLGDYLAAMTTAIEATGGTIDKYIGDAVMALWNAPTPVPDHAVHACRATLACLKAARALYASSSWKGLPALTTRFGLHEARVMVGNFGAPTRLSYTALGDGVNLAARLEPLCKQYGVVVLVSEAIVRRAKGDFVFRRIDRVAVKGKSASIDVYELLGATGDAIANLELARRYEQAFDAYLERDFSKAASLCERQREEDPPSAVLWARCVEMEKAPPPEGWSGVHVATSK
ncbi:MAG: Adenylate cyclase [Labilithrix sp.]|nr:Adenylate cyclase [Labilithrix sp.]